ncbi:MAG: prepilin-type N-terminal cleavage/methylation domain-containing protein [Mycobacteriales bacterium]
MLQRIRKAADEGFTLIELLIVIIILGILAAIVVFAVGSTRSDAVTATCTTDIKTIQLAEEAYKTHSGSYTSDQTVLAGANGNLKSWPTNSAFTLALTGANGYTITVSPVSPATKPTGSVAAADGDTQIAAACAG